MNGNKLGGWMLNRVEISSYPVEFLYSVLTVSIFWARFSHRIVLHSERLIFYEVQFCYPESALEYRSLIVAKYDAKCKHRWQTLCNRRRLESRTLPNSRGSWTRRTPPGSPRSPPSTRGPRARTTPGRRRSRTWDGGRTKFNSVRRPENHILRISLGEILRWCVQDLLCQRLRFTHPNFKMLFGLQWSAVTVTPSWADKLSL